MRLSLTVASLLLLLISPGCSEEHPAAGGRSLRYADPTNVLLFVAPDIGTTLGSYYVKGVQTPRIDKLSRGGTVFLNAYASSAVQGASRASLLSGRMPANLAGEDTPTWGDHFADIGYRTGLIGELGIEGGESMPFDYRSVINDTNVRDETWHTRELDEFLGQDDGRPWALVVCLQDSRWPFPTDEAPFGHMDLPPHEPEAVSVPPKLVDTPGVRREIKRYYDGIRRMDAMLGAVVDRLAARGHRPNTVCLFTSDNGSPFPFARATLYEAGVRVPLIAWGKQVEIGVIRNTLLTHVDILPTLLSVAREADELPPMPESLEESFDGMSFDFHLSEMRILIEEGRTANPARTEVFTTLDSNEVLPTVPSRAVLFGDWKYIRNYSDGKRFESLSMQRTASYRAIVSAAELGDTKVERRMETLEQRPEEELFNLKDDPNELLNLAGDPLYSAQLNEAREKLKNSRLLSLPVH